MGRLISTNRLISQVGDELEDTFSYEVDYSTVAINSKYTNLLPAVVENKSNIDYIDADWDEEIPHADRLDYILAASCGILSGTLSVLWNKLPSLAELKNEGADSANHFVIAIAKAFGYKEKDLEGAIRFLENLFPMATDSLTSEWGGGLQHHLRDFAHHPTPLGLICSILSQFTGMSIGTDTDGSLHIHQLPEDACIGKNFPEKVFLGTIQWAFHLISDMAGSSMKPGAGTGIPGALLSFFKEMSSLPFFQNIHISYKEKEITFSQLLSKVFNGTFFRDNEGNPIRFDLRAEIGIGAYLAKQAFPVVINECLVRCVFTLRQIFKEIKKNNITTIHDLQSIDPMKIIPGNNCVLTRMCTVASATFVSVNIAGTAAKAVIEHKNAKSGSFLLYVNVVGISRLVFACVADAEYIKEDVKKAYRSYREQQADARYRAYMAQKACIDGCKSFQLTERQNLLLLSLRYQSVLADIDKTKYTKDCKLKTLWLEQWKQSMAEALYHSGELSLIEQEQPLFDAIEAEAQVSQDLSWFYILLLEMEKFIPYVPLNREDAEKYKSLKVEYDFFHENFCKAQQLLPTKRIEKLRKALSASKDVLTRGTQNRLIAVGSTAAVAIAAAVGCCVFAPGLAAVLVGNVFTGIHGIALTNASLALIGGGSLAAGGLGVAGGTVILTGGGALVGLIGSGSISAATLLANTSSSFVLNECSKILTICKYSTIGLYGKNDLAESMLVFLENRIDEIKTERLADKLLYRDKDLIKQLDESVRYLVRTCEEIKKLLES